MKQLLLLVSLFTVWALPAWPQTQPQSQFQSKDAAQPSSMAVPVISFDLYWEAATPQNYTIIMDANGKSQYVSRSPTRPSEGSNEPDPDYQLEFTMSASTRDRVLQLTRELNYFNGSFDYTQHKVANTGKKTLTYSDPSRNFHTTYNFSENKSIEELTRIFQGISNTVEHGRKLQFMRRFDKLALASELQALESMSKANYLSEVQIIAPILKNIANDPTVLHLARQSASRLLIVLNP
ncbi:MAG TPA: hypothetical protein VG649_05205 [Candidatus Angelobacter sp.]|jgi:hypothetical protein|nr:hypothetical protein [Candidatus Angelobacter sp.]